MNTRFRKAYEVVGYTYEADYHCAACAKGRFPTDGLSHCFGTDAEGNELGVVFLDNDDADAACADCGACLV